MKWKSRRNKKECHGYLLNMNKKREDEKEEERLLEPMRLRFRAGNKEVRARARFSWSATMELGREARVYCRTRSSVVTQTYNDIILTGLIVRTLSIKYGLDLHWVKRLKTRALAKFIMSNALLGRATTDDCLSSWQVATIMAIKTVKHHHKSSKSLNA